MTNKIKSIYISLYITLLTISFIQTVINFFEFGLMSPWVGIALGTWPALFFFIKLFIAPVARTSANLNILFVFAILGAFVSFITVETPEQSIFFYTHNIGLGLGGLALYIFWYSRLGRTTSEQLSEGRSLPSFQLKTSLSEDWSSDKLTNHPAIMIFFRGNWCPLCMAQIKEVAASYQELEQLGIKVFLISPQPEKFTKTLAKKFDVNYHFMIDKDNVAAKLLGIDSQQGTPKGLEVLGYESDTVLPTVILTDKNGLIIFTDQTDNYRVRPEPDTFLRVFKQHGISAH